MNRDDLISNIKLLLEQYPSTDALNTAYSILKSSLVAPHLSEKILEIFTPMIADEVSFKDFLSFTQACRTTRHWKRRIMKERVNRLLKPYGEVEDFQHLMRDKGCVISGSSALWITEGQTADWVPGDLDLYTPYGTTEEVIDFLCAKGFTKFPTSVQVEEDTGYPEEGAAYINSVTKLVKDRRKVDVIESAEKHAIAPITRFHSTLVMNYLTADSLVLLYPKLTLERTWVPQRAVPYKNNWAPRYEGRHYQRMPDEIGVSPRYCDLFCFKSPRSSGDRHCLFVPYDDKSDWETKSLIEEPTNYQVGRHIASDKKTFNWDFRVLGGDIVGHDYCSQGICKLKFYLAKHPASIVEYTARRTYCDTMKLILVGKVRAGLERDKVFREDVEKTILKIIEYSQLPVTYEFINITKHHRCYGCASSCQGIPPMSYSYP